MIKYVIIEKGRLDEKILISLYKELNYIFLNTIKEAIDVFFEMAFEVGLDICEKHVDGIFVVKLKFSDDKKECKILKTYELKKYLILLD